MRQSFKRWLLIQRNPTTCSVDRELLVCIFVVVVNTDGSLPSTISNSFRSSSVSTACLKVVYISVATEDRQHFPQLYFTQLSRWVLHPQQRSALWNNSLLAYTFWWRKGSCIFLLISHSLKSEIHPPDHRSTAEIHYFPSALLALGKLLPSCHHFHMGGLDLAPLIFPHELLKVSTRHYSAFGPPTWQLKHHIHYRSSCHRYLGVWRLEIE